MFAHIYGVGADGTGQRAWVPVPESAIGFLTGSLTLVGDGTTRIAPPPIELRPFRMDLVPMPPVDGGPKQPTVVAGVWVCEGVQGFYSEGRTFFVAEMRRLESPPE